MRSLESPRSPAAQVEASSVRHTATFISTSAPVAAQELWRTVPSFACGTVELDSLRSFLRDVAILGEPRWREAVSGDAAAAIGIAMEVCDPEDGPSHVFDLAMSALFACVLEDEPAACLVFANIVRRADWLDHVEIDPVDLGLLAEGLNFDIA